MELGPLLGPPRFRPRPRAPRPHPARRQECPRLARKRPDKPSRTRGTVHRSWGASGDARSRLFTRRELGRGAHIGSTHFAEYAGEADPPTPAARCFRLAAASALPQGGMRRMQRAASKDREHRRSTRAGIPRNPWAAPASNRACSKGLTGTQDPDRTETDRNCGGTRC